jgi:23S rRNA (guanosine2251-2'-O)-methyltransferase
MSCVQFVIRQCGNQHCRFRFPAPADQVIQAHCPKCGHLLAQNGQAYENSSIQPSCKFDRNLSLSILLDNVRSALNVGSIIRTAEGIGVEHIHLCGITATPDNPKVGKTALRAESTLKWSYHLNALDAVLRLKNEGVQIWSLEITPKSIPVQDAIKYRSDIPLLLVAGNEQAGVDPGILSVSDRLIHLPMVGSKTSLNIAVAVGIAASILLTPSWV